MDGLVAQGAPLLEVLEQTKNLAAHDPDPEPTNGARPADPGVLPPPDMSKLGGEFAKWNQA